ncbi:MAG: anti-sigma factor, partial [Rhizobiales bacterium]|nr:anti-sigma factor [Hyphomicrobiales bacterium]
HVGREVVLVLEGAFRDDGVRFGPGDVAVAEDGTIHTPQIERGADCLCLAVTEAPVHFTGALGLLLNRFSRF